MSDAKELKIRWYQTYHPALGSPDLIGDRSRVVSATKKLQVLHKGEWVDVPIESDKVGFETTKKNLYGSD